MSCDHAPERCPGSVSRGWKQIPPEVTRPQAVDEIDQSGQHQRPRCLKVKVPTPAILVGQHIAVSTRDSRPRRRDRYLEQWRSQRIAHFAPIKTRVGDEDLNSGNQQSHKRNYCDPVGRTDQTSMAGCLVSLRSSRRHGGSIACTPEAGFSISRRIFLIFARRLRNSSESQ